MQTHLRNGLVTLTAAAFLMTATPGASMASEDASGASSNNQTLATVHNTPHQAANFPGAAESVHDAEVLTPSMVETINTGLASYGKATLPDSAQELQYEESGVISVLNDQNEVVAELGGTLPSTTTVGKDTMTANGILNPTVKRVIGACLGFGGAGAMSLEALVRYLATPKNAVKFVVRRLGVFGAVSCAGGIVWEFI